jgi:Zn-dependent protease/predicted transcriptional regulator
MHSGFRIGKIFGINVFVDWSWIFIFLLITWNLAGAVFPSIHPNWGPGLNIALGILAALLFFISILLHELAHSVVAKARGLPVRRITLFIFGGVSNIEREPRSPVTEFFMAVVGPITSLLLGYGFYWLGTQNINGIASAVNNPTPFLRSLGPLSTMLLWLGPINILIGIFNLIPGFPMDGGRILRAILWGVSGNLRLATRWATLVGQAIGWIFGVAGIAMLFGVNIPLLGTGIINGLWLAFIGWFLVNAASQSYQRVVIEDMLEGISIDRLIHEAPPSVAPDLPLSSLIYDYVLRSEENESAFPVMEGEQLLGMVYVKNVRDVDRDYWETTTVRDVMVPENELEVVTPRDDAMVAFQKMAQQEVRQVPVVQNGTLVGMLRRKDFMRWLQMHSETSQ